MSTPQIPNTGRILDVWLGGSSHFPVDAAAAAAFDQIYPRFPEVFKTLRGFIGRSSQAIANQGIDRFFVMGAGIPAQGNVHEAVEGAKVIYSDIDADNVSIGKKLLSKYPDCDYVLCDATDEQSIKQHLNSTQLGDDGKQAIGIILVGLSVFLNDIQLTGLLASLYKHSASGSMLAFDLDSLQLTQYPQAMAMLGDSFFPRTPEKFEPLLDDWQLTASGIQPVQSWGLDTISTDIPVFMYGGIAVKP